MRVVALAGGTGSAKLLRGLQRHGRFSAVSNVGDNIWMHGLYVCPDVDIAVYALAGILDRERGWGIAGDTFGTLSQLKRLGAETWFNLGDLDMATHVLRTQLLGQGKSLTQVTALISRRLGVKEEVLPASDEDVETHVVTKQGEMHLQEFWVRERARPAVLSLKYRGATRARATREVRERLASADRIVVCPANPLTSVMPILSVAGMRSALRLAKGRRVAVSPMIGTEAVSGPAGKLMRATGNEPTSLGVARLYRGLIDVLIVDERDAGQAREIERTGVSCVSAPTLMNSGDDEANLAALTLSV